MRARFAGIASVASSTAVAGIATLLLSAPLTPALGNTEATDITILESTASPSKNSAEAALDWINYNDPADLQLICADLRARVIDAFKASRGWGGALGALARQGCSTAGLPTENELNLDDEDRKASPTTVTPEPPPPAALGPTQPLFTPPGPSSPPRTGDLPAVWCTIERTVTVIPGVMSKQTSVARCDDVPRLGPEWTVVDSNLTFPQANKHRDASNTANQPQVWCLIQRLLPGQAKPQRGVVRCDNIAGVGPDWTQIGSNLTWPEAFGLPQPPIAWPPRAPDPQIASLPPPPQITQPPAPPTPLPPTLVGPGTTPPAPPATADSCPSGSQWYSCRWITNAGVGGASSEMFLCVPPNGSYSAGRCFVDHVAPGAPGSDISRNLGGFQRLACAERPKDQADMERICKERGARQKVTKWNNPPPEALRQERTRQANTPPSPPPSPGSSPSPANKCVELQQKLDDSQRKQRELQASLDKMDKDFREETAETLRLLAEARRKHTDERLVPFPNRPIEKYREDKAKLAEERDNEQKIRLEIFRLDCNKTPPSPQTSTPSPPPPIVLPPVVVTGTTCAELRAELRAANARKRAAQDEMEQMTTSRLETAIQVKMEDMGCPPENINRPQEATNTSPPPLPPTLVGPGTPPSQECEALRAKAAAEMATITQARLKRGAADEVTQGMERLQNILNQMKEKGCPTNDLGSEPTQHVSPSPSNCPPTAAPSPAPSNSNTSSNYERSRSNTQSSYYDRTNCPPTQIATPSVPPSDTNSDSCDVARQRLGWINEQLNRKQDDAATRSSSYQAWMADLRKQQAAAIKDVKDCGGTRPPDRVASLPTDPPSDAPPPLPPIDITTLIPGVITLPPVVINAPPPGPLPPPTLPPTTVNAPPPGPLPPPTVGPTTPPPGPATPSVADTPENCPKGSQWYSCRWITNAGVGGASSEMYLCVPPNGNYSAAGCFVDYTPPGAPGSEISRNLGGFQRSSCPDRPKNQADMERICKDRGVKKVTKWGSPPFASATYEIPPKHQPPKKKVVHHPTPPKHRQQPQQQVSTHSTATSAAVIGIIGIGIGIATRHRGTPGGHTAAPRGHR